MRQLLGVALLSLITFVGTASAQTPASLIDHALADLAEAKRLLAPPPPVNTPAVVTVPAGSTLVGVQAVVDANPGAIISLPSGIYTGQLILRGTKGGTLTTAGFTPGAAMTPATAVSLAKIKVQGQMQTPLVAEGCGWTVRGLEITGEANELVLQTQTACDFTVDRSYIHGDAATGTKRGVTLNGANGKVTNSWVSDVKRKGQDAAGIGGWDGPGPYLIDGNYIQASAYSVIFGGADPNKPGLIPSDITITNNHMAKDPLWMGQGYGVKNVLELKNARRVYIANNILEHSWTDGQTGFAVLFTVRNQDGTCPWCTIEDVVFEKNVIRNVGAAFNILGTDNNFPSGTAKRIAIRDNTIDVCNSSFPGAARLIMIEGNPEGIEFTRNVFTNCPGGWLATFMEVSGVTKGFIANGNVFPEGEYGLHSADAPLGTGTLEVHAPGYIWTGNTVLKFDNGRTIPYPVGTVVK